MDKVALVTGSTSGIGLATAVALRDAGFRVVASGRRQQLASPLPAGVNYVSLDVTDDDSVAHAVRETIRRFGRIDVLVNNAGFGQLGALEAVTPEMLRRQFDVNVFGVHSVTRSVLPYMRAHGGGRIITIGSVGGTFTAPGAGAYHMSKWAIEAFSDALRYEAAPFGVDVVLIQPTGVKTHFVDTIVASLPDADGVDAYSDFHATVSERTSAMFQGRARGIIEPSQVANVVVQAATSRRPRTRYVVGWSARLYRRLRRLTSDRSWDRIMGQAFPFPTPRPNSPSSS
jgi:NAD(P)-dependent dehydrogenase (short-subunit alcohol dehydrogenase family)